MQYINKLLFLFLCISCFNCSFGQKFQTKDQQLDVIKASDSTSLGFHAFRFNLLINPDSAIKEPVQFDVKILKDKKLKYSSSSIFEIQTSDSLVHLIDSIGLDSLKKDSVFSLDTLISFNIPIRSIMLEKGIHPLKIEITAKEHDYSFVLDTFLQIPEIHHAIIDIRQLEIQKDPNINPLSLKYHDADPIIKLYSKDQKLLWEKAFKDQWVIEHVRATVRVVKGDQLYLEVINSDPKASKGFTRLALGDSNFVESSYQDSFLKKLNYDLKYHISDPPSSRFNCTEHFFHNGLEGVLLNFQYDLPYRFKNVDLNQVISSNRNITLIEMDTLSAVQKVNNNRISGNYLYFISYYDLQNVRKLNLDFSSPVDSLFSHTYQLSEVPKTLDDFTLRQIPDYSYNGCTGILFKYSFVLNQLPANHILRLIFPKKAPDHDHSTLFWYESDNEKLGIEEIVLKQELNQVFNIFMPYAYAKENISLDPALCLVDKNGKIIYIASLKTNKYSRPKQIFDLQIYADEPENTEIQGLSGVLFQYKIDVPEYYHNNGDFVFQIHPFKFSDLKQIWLNGSLYDGNAIKIFNQDSLKIFIPHQLNSKNDSLQVKLWASNENIILSNISSQSYVCLEQRDSASIILQKFSSKEWDETILKIGVRKNNQYNSTYEQLNYDFVHQISLNDRVSPKTLEPFRIELLKDDALVFWLEDALTGDYELISTSLKKLLEQKGTLDIKNQGPIKTLKISLKMD